MVVEVAVIGAGIIGLSSAVAIQQRMPGVKVTIIASRFGRHTTSNGAGGIFVPTAKGVEEELSHRWARDSSNHFFNLARSSESGTSGVNLTSGYEVLNSDTFPGFLKYMPFCVKLSPEQMKQFQPYYKYGYMYTTLIIESPKYMPWLTDRFLAKGGILKEQTVKSFEELCGKYDVIVNCTGLESTLLTPDPNLQPLRGHVVRVSAPWIKHFVHTDDHRYILPAAETAAIGGIKQPGRTDLTPISEDSNSIMEGMEARFPALKGAKILWEWVGLRPDRDRVRLEMEVIQCKGKQLKVIHNYGHGANGISLSWGTGLHAAELVEQAIKTQAKL